MPKDKTFRILPAIDIRDGRCVRLYQGDYGQETVFAHNPVAAADRWASQGGVVLHVVDLDGAAQGRPVNLDIVTRIASLPGVAVELGGGLRSRKSVSLAFEAGVSWAVLGTSAMAAPELLAELVQAYGDRIITSVDFRSGKVVSDGWRNSTGLDYLAFGQRLRDTGVRRVVVTDVLRDGAMVGPDLEGAKALACLGLEVIVSGGVGHIGHVRDVAQAARDHEGIVGLIIGRALYTGDICLREAISEADAVLDGR